MSDYQTGGMGDGEYSPQGFLSGWNIGNEAAYKSFPNKMKEKPLTLPTQEIEQYWKWNYDKKLFQEELQEDIFVPKYMFFILNGVLKPAIVWTDGIPITLPEVETVIMYRKELAPKKGFSKKPDFAITTKHELDPFLSKYPTRERYVNYYFLDYDYDERPKEIINFIKNLAPHKEGLINITTDKILDSELLEKYT
ncbi:MAG: hypothetical protein HYX80_07950 [Chloroflexi bacterium]|nr:hypothetical protein [Chloroflexota bacterium]